jgi:hypothetical protein
VCDVCVCVCIHTLHSVIVVQECKPGRPSICCIAKFWMQLGLFTILDVRVGTYEW